MGALASQISSMLRGKLLTNMEHALALEAYGKLGASRHGTRMGTGDATAIARGAVAGGSSSSMDYYQGASATAAAAHQYELAMRMQQQQQKQQQQFPLVPRFPGSFFDNGAVNFDDMMMDSARKSDEDISSSCSSSNNSSSRWPLNHANSSDSSGSTVIGGFTRGNTMDSNFSCASSGKITRTGTLGSNYGSVPQDGTSAYMDNLCLSRGQTLHGSSLARSGSSVLGGRLVSGGSVSGINCSSIGEQVHGYLYNPNPPSNPLTRAGTLSDFYAPPNSTCASQAPSVYPTRFNSYNNTPRGGFGASSSSQQQEYQYGRMLPNGGLGENFSSSMPSFMPATGAMAAATAATAPGRQACSPNTVFSPTQMQNYISETIESKSVSALDLLVNTVMYISNSDGDVNDKNAQVTKPAHANAHAHAVDHNFTSQVRSQGTSTSGNTNSGSGGSSSGVVTGRQESFDFDDDVPTGYTSARGSGGREFDPFTVTVPIGSGSALYSGVYNARTVGRPRSGESGVKRLNSADSTSY
jgi:hypothetical protein